MKNLIRAFALSLVVTGAFASAELSRHAAQGVTVATTSAIPVPCCPPDDPAACHIADGN